MPEILNDQPSSEDKTSPDEDLPLIDLDAPHTRRLPWRRRAVHLVLLILALSIVLAATWSILFPLPLSPPTASALLISNVNYGSVTVNGTRLAGKPPIFVTLYQRPANTITLSTPPFRSVTCHILFASQPHARFRSPDDPTHCGVYEGAPGDFGSITINGIVYRPTLLVRLTLVFADLPSDQNKQASYILNQRTARSLHTVVPNGNYIVTSAPSPTALTSQRTTEPLMATASLVPDLAGISCNPSSCPPMFGSPRLTPTPAGQIWYTFFPVELNWRFTSASETLVSDVTFPLDFLTVFDAFFLSYDSKQGWQIVEGVPDSHDYQLRDRLCITGLGRLQALLGMGTSIHMDHDRGIEGCVLNLLDSDGSSTHFIWRFGVLLAVDSAAQARVPSLPLAPSEELAVVGG
jgi:hypothetical protein